MKVREVLKVLSLAIGVLSVLQKDRGDESTNPNWSGQLARDCEIFRSKPPLTSITRRRSLISPKTQYTFQFCLFPACRSHRNPWHSAAAMYFAHPLPSLKRPVQSVSLPHKHISPREEGLQHLTDSKEDGKVRIQ